MIGVDASSGRITGASVNGANAATLGGAGGLQTHTLTNAETPLQPHTHGVTGPSSTIGGGTPGYYPSNGTGSGTLTSASTSAAGSAHSNTQPWLTCNYIIKL